MAMSEEILRRRIHRHNALEMLKATVLFPGAAVLWFLSFWLFRALIYIPLAAFGFDAWGFSFFAAWVGLAILAWEGFQFNVPTIDLEDLDDISFGNGLLGQALSLPFAMGTARRTHGDVMTCAIVVAQFVFAAPRATRQAFESLQSRIHAEPAAIAQAVEVFRKLDLERHWLPAADFPGFGGGLFLLDRLDMVWTKLEDGAQLVRIPAGSQPADFQ
jgi:hypothetical protein